MNVNYFSFKNSTFANFLIHVPSEIVCLKISSVLILVLNINFDENIDRPRKSGYFEKYFDYFLVLYMD